MRACRRRGCLRGVRLATLTLLAGAVVQLLGAHAQSEAPVITNIGILDLWGRYWGLPSGGGLRLKLVGTGLYAPDGSFEQQVYVMFRSYSATVVPFLSTPEALVVESPAIPVGANTTLQVCNHPQKCFSLLLG